MGKTYLVRASFQNYLCFEVTGMRDASLKEQLANFTRALSQRVEYNLTPPRSWVEAFELLERFLLGVLAEGNRKVMFLDELPWLCAVGFFIRARSLLEPISKSFQINILNVAHNCPSKSVSSLDP